MVTEYDEQGNYKYPEGFDPETNEWLEGFDAQREKWEQEYAAAQARWEAHKKQPSPRRSRPRLPLRPTTRSARLRARSRPTARRRGTLADDESLAALREKLSSNN